MPAHISHNQWYQDGNIVIKTSPCYDCGWQGFDWIHLPENYELPESGYAKHHADGLCDTKKNGRAATTYPCHPFVPTDQPIPMQRLLFY